MNKPTNRKKAINDLLLVVAIAVVTLLAFGIFMLTMKQGSEVNVIIDGEAKHTYPLNEDMQTVITVGEWQNKLVIKDGMALIETANCPDKICAAHRPISKDGETIVCLPHRLVIEVAE